MQNPSVCPAAQQFTDRRTGHQKGNTQVLNLPRSHRLGALIRRAMLHRLSLALHPSASHEHLIAERSSVAGFSDPPATAVRRTDVLIRRQYPPCHLRFCLLALNVAQDLAGRVPAACPHYAAALVTCRTANIKAAHRRPMIGPAGHLAQREQLSQAQVVML